MKLIFIILLIFFSGISYAFEKRNINVARIDTPPTIDGKLNEECWKKATASAPFIKFNTTSELAAQQTQAYVLYDDKNLYFGFRCSETKMEELKRLKYEKVSSTPDKLKNAMFFNSMLKTADFNYLKGENIEIFLSPGLMQNHYIQFMVNTSGAGKVRFQTGDPLHIGELPWEYAVFLGDDFFSIEVAIPFSVLHLSGNSPKEWGMNLCRSILLESTVPTERYTSWNPCKGSFGNTNSFGILTLRNINLSQYQIEINAEKLGMTNIENTIWINDKSLKNRKLCLDCKITRINGGNRNISSILDFSDDKKIKFSLGVLHPDDEGALIELKIIDKNNGNIVYQGAIQTEDVTLPFSYLPDNALSSKDDVIIDYFKDNSLKNWNIASKYWSDNKPNPIPANEEIAEMEFTGDKSFYMEGNGAIKVYFPGGLLGGKYPIRYAVLSKFFDPENMEKCDTLVFWIYNHGGGGKIDIKLFNNKNWTSNVSLGQIAMDTPGFKKCVLKFDGMRKNMDIWKNLNCITFTCFGDFTAYLSGLRMTSQDKIGNCDINSSNFGGKYEEIPSEDVTLSYN